MWKQSTTPPFFLSDATWLEMMGKTRNLLEMLISGEQFLSALAWKDLGKLQDKFGVD
jgi:hypothetical protein